MPRIKCAKPGYLSKARNVYFKEGKAFDAKDNGWQLRRVECSVWGR